MKKIIVMVIAVLLSFGGSALAKESSDWAKDSIVLVNEKGLLPLEIEEKNLTENITRREFVHLAMNMFDLMKPNKNVTIKCPFTDCTEEYIKRAYSLGIVNGKSETEFCPNDLITRQEIAKILINTLKKADKNITVSKSDFHKTDKFTDFENVSDWAKDDILTAIKYEILSGVTDTELAPFNNATREQSVAIISRSVYNFARNSKSYAAPKIQQLQNGDEISKNTEIKWKNIQTADEYYVIIKDKNANLIDKYTVMTNETNILVDKFEYGGKYTVTLGAKLENGKTLFSEPTEFTYIAIKEKPPQFSFLTLKEKYQRVFPLGIAFETEEDAKQNMTMVTVPGWKLKSDGSKVAAKYEICVNRELAEDVVGIFTEIFEDSEQFPIKDVGGYCWRQSAMGKVSEHSYGTCIDINYDENYYCYAESGEAITGSFWKPYENPYSIPEDGSVVRIFAKYGWAWGGNAWTRLRDYMHFTYLGN